MPGYPDNINRASDGTLLDGLARHAHAELRSGAAPSRHAQAHDPPPAPGRMAVPQHQYRRRGEVRREPAASSRRSAISRAQPIPWSRPCASTRAISMSAASSTTASAATALPGADPELDRPALLLGSRRMIFDPLLDLFRGKAVTIPPMDGALRPNTALDEAEVGRTERRRRTISAPTAAGATSPADRRSSRLPAWPAMRRSRPPVSTRRSPRSRPRRRATSRSRWMTAASQVGTAALCRRRGGLACPTALAFGDADTLYVCQGSAHHRASDWVVDLMEKNATGSVWRIDLASGKREPAWPTVSPFPTACSSAAEAAA